MAQCAIDEDGVTYNGDTYIAIRSSKHNNSSAYTHQVILGNLIGRGCILWHYKCPEAISCENRRTCWGWRSCSPTSLSTSPSWSSLLMVGRMKTPASRGTSLCVSRQCWWFRSDNEAKIVDKYYLGLGPWLRNWGDPGTWTECLQQVFLTCMACLCFQKNKTVLKSFLHLQTFSLE